MPESRDPSPSEDYFNDLSQQPDAGDEAAANGQVPKPKRIACVLCRKRKLRCDGNKPSCGTCTRLQHDCSYDEVRRKSGPKRGYVKALEARLAQVETLLKTQDDAPSTTKTAGGGAGGGGSNINGAGTSNTFHATARGLSGDLIGGYGGNDFDMLHSAGQQHLPPDFALGGDTTGVTAEPVTEEAFPWEMIGLGLDEPLPNQDVINELNQAYFDKIHPSMPMIHRPRYYAAMNLAPHVRPPVCLRYAMWANAATVTDKFEALHEHFYLRARKYIQQDEMKGHGESMISISHAQTWILLAEYEFKLMYFPRAWISAGRGTRMVQMMGLHRLDGVGLDVKQCLPPPKDWTEREERRRTFWMSFCVDRYSSIGTGWPMTIDERDIMTTLPCEEDCYELSKGGKSVTLDEALSAEGVAKLSSLGGVILMACLFGRNLLHLHRPSTDDADDDLNGGFWKRHRELDNVLLNVSLSLPDRLRMPTAMNDANAVWFNMCVHTSTICLHQAAIFKADRNRMPARISADSKVRCISAAAETATIMRQISHLDLSTMNPFISFALYVAARVFVQYLKSRPKDTQIQASLQFLLSAMQAIKRKNPLTESFLVQLDVDLEGAGVDSSFRNKPIHNLPDQPVRSESCPVSQLGIGEGTTPTYNDISVPGYTSSGPTGTTASVSSAPSAPSREIHTFADATLRGFSNESTMGFISGMQQYELPSRVRSPASNPSSTLHRSPQSYNSNNMDTSPDGSGGAEQPTPNSSNHSHNNISTHTSHTGYSPPNLQQPADQPSPGRLLALFPPNDNSFAADLDMQNFTATPGASYWPSSGTGFTPGPSGMTPGASGSNVLGLSDADWNQLMENMTYSQWQSNEVNQAGVQGMNQG